MDDPHAHPSTALFVQFLTKHQRALNSFIVSLVPTRADADDVMQETSLALWRKWDEYDTDREFLPWACGVAHIQVLRHRRKTATDRLWFDVELLDLLGTQMLENADLFEMRREALDRCLQKLDERDRVLLDQRYQEGQSIGQLAETLGLTTRTIHRFMSRIRRQLQRCILATVREWQNSPA